MNDFTREIGHGSEPRPIFIVQIGFGSGPKPRVRREIVRSSKLQGRIAKRIAEGSESKVVSLREIGEIVEKARSFPGANQLISGPR